MTNQFTAMAESLPLWKIGRHENGRYEPLGEFRARDRKEAINKAARKLGLGKMDRRWLVAAKV